MTPPKNPKIDFLPQGAGATLIFESARGHQVPSRDLAIGNFSAEEHPCLPGFCASRRNRVKKAFGDNSILNILNSFN